MGWIMFSTLGGVGRMGKPYAHAHYRFSDSEVIQSTYFADALLRHFSGSSRRLRKFVILGTDRSMWDEALRVLAPNQPEMEQLRLALFDAALEDGVSEPLLRDASDMLSRALGFSVEALRIPYCRSGDDALDIVKMLHARVSPKDEIIFDVTHGLRYLAMIGLFASLAVEALKDAQVREVYYGAYETPQADGTAPVVRLEGLLEMLRWIKALTVHEARGDLAAMGPLLAGDIGHAESRRIAESAFFEQTLRLTEARDASRDVLGALSRTQNPVARLFRPKIERQLSWARKDDLAECQFELAQKHLETNNFLLAALLGSEAALTWLMTDSASPVPMPDLDPTDGRSRMEARERVRSGLRRHPLGPSYRDLAELRNALAHAGNAQSEETRSALKSPGALRARLSKLFAGFFGA